MESKKNTKEIQITKTSARVFCGARGGFGKMSSPGELHQGKEIANSCVLFTQTSMTWKTLKSPLILYELLSRFNVSNFRRTQRT